MLMQGQFSVSGCLSDFSQSRPLINFQRVDVKVAATRSAAVQINPPPSTFLSVAAGQADAKPVAFFQACVQLLPRQFQLKTCRVSPHASPWEKVAGGGSCVSGQTGEWQDGWRRTAALAAHACERAECSTCCRSAEGPAGGRRRRRAGVVEEGSGFQGDPAFRRFISSVSYLQR